MSFETNQYKLSDIIDIIGGGTPKRSTLEYWSGDIPWLSVVDFNSDSRFVYDTKEKITSLGLKQSSTKLLNADQLIISARGTVGCLAQLKKPMAFNQSCYGLSGKDGLVENNYLYYLMKEKVSELKQKTHGAVFDTITRNTFDYIDVEIPNIHTQQVISKILGDLDHKIENNRKTNETLEAMAQAVFKSWFVDFEPTRAKIAALEAGGSADDATFKAMTAISGKNKAELELMRSDSPEAFEELKSTAALFPSSLQDSELGQIPEGWVASEIGDEVTVVGGGTPSTKNSEFWDGGTIHWTTPKDMSNLTDKVLIDTNRRITDKGLSKISSGLLPIDTVLMSSRAPVGYLAIAKVPVAINQGYIAMKCEQTLSPEFVVQWCASQMDEIKQRASGTTFAEISKKSFKIIPVIVPILNAIEKYNAQVESIYLQIESNMIEIQTLTQTRDALLPKLLSGEIDVSAFVDKEVI